MDKGVSEVFYRKFRPRQLTHLVGQDHIVKMLTKTCESGFFHHAYLMVGKLGTGKTSTARILANLINCTGREPGSAKLCGECEACKTIRFGKALDVEEFDAASKRTIDSIRDVIQSGRYSPQSLPMKIFIIDECHKLSNDAMKALLKPLEEPAPTTVFILCTTEQNKVPSEVASRCQKLRFRPVSVKDITELLLKVFAHQNQEIESAAVVRIAEAAEGSVRNALEIAQEICIILEGNITEVQVSSFLGLVGKEVLYDFVECIHDENLEKAFGIINALVSESIDCEQVCKDLSVVCENMMLAKVSCNLLGSIPRAEREIVARISAHFTERQLASFVNLFADANRALEVNVNSKWVLEALVVKMIEKISVK